MTSYQRFNQLNLNFSAIGMEQDDTDGTYFCTPKGAKVIGWAGLDGIHCCFIQGFGEMVFTVNPENMSREYVHPVARNFVDFLRLLLSCKDLKMIEELYHFDEERLTYLMERYESTEEQLAVLDTLQKTFSIAPMEHPVTYVRQLQEDFDYSKLQYTQMYYDEIAENEGESEQWQVTYDGNFWGSTGQIGREIPVNKAFVWGKEKWRIPSIYVVCGRGLVVDFCVEVEPEAIKAFIDKWDLLHEAENTYTQRQYKQMEQEDPRTIEFYPKLMVNGRYMKEERGCSVSWIPQSCIDGGHDLLDAKQAMEHYGLDESRGWLIVRKSFAWQAAPITTIKSLHMHLERAPEMVEEIQFEVDGAGDHVSFTNPITGIEHTLTVQRYEQQEIDLQSLPNDGMEYPNHYTTMTYTLSPDLPEENVRVQDLDEVDRPRIISQKNPELCAAAIGIIGGADGPTAIYIADENCTASHRADSSLRFEPVTQVHWNMEFWEKRLDDISVTLI